MVIRQLAKDSAIYGGADMLSKTISFFTFPFIAKALSPESFGFLELIITSTALLGVVGNFGINNSVQRFYWDPEVNQENRTEIVSSGMFTQLITIIVTVLVGFLVVYFGKPYLISEAYPYSLLGIGAGLILMAGNQWTQFTLDIIRLHFKPWSFLVISMVSRVLAAIAGLWMVVSLNLGIDGLLAAQAIVVILVLPFAIKMICGEVTFSSFSINRAKELISYGYPFIFTALAYWIFTSQDRWMLASMSSVEEVGIYSVSFRFASIIFFVSSAFGQAWSPVAIKIRTDNPLNYRKIYGDVLILLFFGMAFLAGVLGLFSGEVLDLLMGKDYIKSGLPMAVLGFAVVFQATQQITGMGISLEKKTTLFAHLSWVTTAMNFGMNWLLIPKFGALGAAWATAISYLFLTGSYFFFTQKYHPIEISYKRLSAFVLLILMIPIASFLLYQQEINLEYIFWKILLLIAFAGIGWFLLPLKSLKNV